MAETTKPTPAPKATETQGLKGMSGAPDTAVPAVDPDNLPVEVAPGVVPDAGGDSLFAAALVKAPNLTKEFVKAYGLTDETLTAIARGEVSPPPVIGPEHTADLYLTPGGWQQTPKGVKPEDVGRNAISR